MRIRRGFQEYRKIAKDHIKVIVNCKSCVFYDDDEGCLNNEVTQFDIVITETKKYCTYWKGYKPYSKKEEEDF